MLDNSVRSDWPPYDIELKREIPEAMKPRRIEIGNAASVRQDNAPERLAQAVKAA